MPQVCIGSYQSAPEKNEAFQIKLRVPVCGTRDAEVHRTGCGTSLNA
jgi:hypothetical protein